MKLYEWTLEEIDRESEDIIDSDFSNTLESFKRYFNDSNFDIGLVLDEGNEIEGVINREWAYIKNNSLPEYFSNSYGEETNNKVPNKYKIQLQKVLQSF